MKRLCIDIRLLGTFVAILGLVAFVLRFTGLSLAAGGSDGRGLCRGCPLDRAGVDQSLAPSLLVASVEREDQRGRDRRQVVRTRLLGNPRLLLCPGGSATVLLARAVIRFSGIYRAQAELMLFGVLLPWLVDVADMRRMFGFIPVDLVSTSFAVTGLTFLPALYPVPTPGPDAVAWAAVVKLMDDPVIVMDSCVSHRFA